MAVCFVTLAIPIQFAGFSISIAWALEGAVLSWIGARSHDKRALFLGAAVFCLVVFRLLYFDAWPHRTLPLPALLWNGRFLTFLVAAACLLLAARWVGRTEQVVSLCEYFTGHGVLLWGLSLEVLDWAERSTAAPNLLSVQTVALSILFGGYALLLVAFGVGTRTAVNRIAGLVLIGLVIVKLYLFDVWQLGHVYRISAFIALGVFLIFMSFLYSRFRRLV